MLCFHNHGQLQAVLFLYMAVHTFVLKKQDSMAIENEIVRFIAEMELDPQDQAKFVEGLRQAEEQCESLRKQSIADAIATAEQAKLILDELFERKNSLEINTVDINVEINKLMSKVRDVSKKLVRSMVFTDLTRF